tara:strand:- start:825 stop:959 length:135 start_codon:yes stop_codon:yes gene_type:complete
MNNFLIAYSTKYNALNYVNIIATSLEEALGKVNSFPESFGAYAG